MYMGRCLLVVFLVLVFAVSVQAATSDLSPTNQTICSNDAGRPSGCAQADRAVRASSARVISLWGGARESIALKSDGTVWTWGLSSCSGLGTGPCGKLGDGTEISRSIPIQVHGPGNIGYLT